jgi:mannitol-1-/sugar-/sorbitol-6-phosphatase
MSLVGVDDLCCAPSGKVSFMRGHAIFIPLTLTCKAVLFDMDGTLVDSTSVVERAWGWWAKRHGIPLEAALSFSHGRPTIATMDHFLPGHDHAEELGEMARYEETELEGILAVPGAMQIVCALHKHPWAIVTSAWRTLAEARVAAAGLPLPKVIVPVDEIRTGKPDPEGFLCAAERLGVPPEECLVFEDTRPGIEAGINAGMQVVGILTTMPASQLRHRPLIRDFRDVAIRPQGDDIKVDLRDASVLDFHHRE